MFPVLVRRMRQHPRPTPPHFDVARQVPVPPLLRCSEQGSTGKEAAPLACSSSTSSNSRLGAGARVLARFDGRTRWYPGTVLIAHEDGTFAIKFDTGEEKKHLPTKYVKPMERDSTGVAIAASLSPGPTTEMPAATSDTRTQSMRNSLAGSRSIPHDGGSQKLVELLNGIGKTSPSWSLLRLISAEVRSVPEDVLLDIPKAVLRSLLEHLHVLIEQACKSTAAGGPNDEDRSQSAGADLADDSDEEIAAAASTCSHALDAALLLLSIITVPKVRRPLVSLHLCFERDTHEESVSTCAHADSPRYPDRRGP